jgi:ribonuclease P protein component
MAKTFSYNKAEKLKSRKLLEQLFANGKSFLVFPVKVIYLQVDASEATSLVQAGVGASSRNFKHATDRNRIKRLLREHYRLNKIPLHEFLEVNNKKVAVFFLYIDKAMPEKHVLPIKMPVVIDKLINALS